MLFKVAECTYKSKEPINWAQIDLYTEEEKLENSSIFLTNHKEHLADGSLTDFATVSSTVVLIDNDNTIHFYERVYDHSHERE